jgi:hypothetical protein
MCEDRRVTDAWCGGCVAAFLCMKEQQPPPALELCVGANGWLVGWPTMYHCSLQALHSTACFTGCAVLCCAVLGYTRWWSWEACCEARMCYC